MDSEEEFTFIIIIIIMVMTVAIMDREGVILTLVFLALGRGRDERRGEFRLMSAEMMRSAISDATVPCKGGGWEEEWS